MASQRMRTADFDYVLPAGCIAQTPLEPRDSARMLVLDRTDGSIQHAHVRDLPSFLSAKDCIVLNDTRVLPARLVGRRESGGLAEILLLRKRGDGCWEALAKPGRRLKTGQRVLFGDGAVVAEITGELAEGLRLVRLSDDAAALKLGAMPLPPYITAPLGDPERYQTIFARHTGSAAAPTAGLHFTSELLQRLEEAGIGRAFVTLHVGLDTFRPVAEDDPASHPMHSEWFHVPTETALRLNAIRSAGGRVVAVGTTSVRTLESACTEQGTFVPKTEETRLFIRPGYRFHGVDVLLTNFHLPKSTLLMLVSAFAGRELVLDAYRVAIEQGYRFFSFGDAMLIL